MFNPFDIEYFINFILFLKYPLSYSLPYKYYSRFRRIPGVIYASREVDNFPQNRAVKGERFASLSYF